MKHSGDYEKMNMKFLKPKSGTNLMDVKNSVHTHKNLSLMPKVERHFLHFGKIHDDFFFIFVNERKSARNDVHTGTKICTPYK